MVLQSRTAPQVQRYKKLTNTTGQVICHSTLLRMQSTTISMMQLPGGGRVKTVSHDSRNVLMDKVIRRIMVEAQSLSKVNGLNFPKSVGSVCFNPFATLALSAKLLFPRRDIVGSHQSLLTLSLTKTFPIIRTSPWWAWMLASNTLPLPVTDSISRTRKRCNGASGNSSGSNAV